MIKHTDSFLLESKEDYDELCTAFQHVNPFLEDPKLADGRVATVWEGGESTSAQTCRLTCTAGDLKWIMTKLGLRATFSGGKCCPWCEVEKAQLASVESSTTRTYARLVHGAHLPLKDKTGQLNYNFKCPHCNLQFKDKAHWDKEQLSDSKLRDFSKTHANAIWRRPPISVTEPSMFVLCILHLRLSFVRSLWTHCITPIVRDTETAAKLNAMLQHDGVNVRQLKAIRVLSDLECIDKTSFTGGAADKFLSKFESYITAAGVKAADMAGWLQISSHMTHMIAELRRRTHTQQERQVKATNIQATAKSLLHAWTKNVGTHSCTWYMHASYHHLPDLIRRLPCDILDASGEGIEQKNQRTKSNIRR
jgi:hypothetical protein